MLQLKQTEKRKLHSFAAGGLCNQTRHVEKSFSSFRVWIKWQQIERLGREIGEDHGLLRLVAGWDAVLVSLFELKEVQSPIDLQYQFPG